MSVTSPAVFHDRREAGRRLAARLERLRHEAPVVLALARGGVPVAAEVADALAAPLDVIVVHKAGSTESRVGAVAEGGLAVVDHDRARALGMNAERLSALRQEAAAAADAMARRLRAGAAPRDIVGRTVVLVDDGAGTGMSAVAAARTARRRGAARVVLAVPVMGAAVLARLGETFDEIVCVEVAPLARWYEHVPAVSDEDIAEALGPHPAGAGWQVPEAARGAVVLASPCVAVRRRLEAMRFATLTLAPGAGADAVGTAVDRLLGLPGVEHLPIGCFGLGTTAEVALTAGRNPAVRAVVAAGGRPDRVAGTVTAATLLVVGGEDRVVRRLAAEAAERFAGDHALDVVPGATHDFPEPGALEQVAQLTGTWFAKHL